MSDRNDGATTIAGILLDIEGTTSSIDFVYDVMFPFARKKLFRLSGRAFRF